MQPRSEITHAQRRAITAMLGELPDDLLRAVRDARGHAFQRLEFVGDAVLELVVRLHADLAGESCPACRGDADAAVTDHALADVAQANGIGTWLEWEASRERLADLVEACSGAVWAARGWVALADLVDAHVHPLAPLTPAQVGDGVAGATDVRTNGELRRGREVLGASVIEVAAATTVYLASDAPEGELTDERNRLYAARRVVDRAQAAGWLDGVRVRHDRASLAAARDVVERRLADLALDAGVAAAVEQATALLLGRLTPGRE